MEILKYPMSHGWDVAINRYHDGKQGTLGWKRWMYEARAMAEEVPCMEVLFGLERRGKLANLTCCFGVKCAKCPELLALDKMERATSKEIDLAKAWTCATHVSQCSDILKLRNWILGHGREYVRRALHDEDE